MSTLRTAQGRDNSRNGSKSASGDIIPFIVDPDDRIRLSVDEDEVVFGPETAHRLAGLVKDAALRHFAAVRDGIGARIGDFAIAGRAPRLMPAVATHFRLGAGAARREGVGRVLGMLAAFIIVAALWVPQPVHAEEDSGLIDLNLPRITFVYGDNIHGEIVIDAVLELEGKVHRETLMRALPGLRDVCIVALKGILETEGAPLSLSARLNMKRAIKVAIDRMMGPGAVRSVDIRSASVSTERRIAQR